MTSPFWAFFGFVSGVVWWLGALAFFACWMVDRAEVRRIAHERERLARERRDLELAEARLRQAQMERWSLAPRRVVPPPAGDVRWN